jgi:hypothetical protein
MPLPQLALDLLVHGSKHSWASIDWLVDIAELARARNVAWDEVIEMARRHGARRRVALGLSLARDLLDAPLPDEALRHVEDAQVDSIAASIKTSLFAPEYVTPSAAGVVLSELALCDSWRRRLVRVARLARPTPGDWQWTRLPRRLAFLYWALRPVRLALKYLFTHFQRTRAAATPRTPPPRPRSTG